MSCRDTVVLRANLDTRRDVARAMAEYFSGQEAATHRGAHGDAGEGQDLRYRPS